VADLQVTCINKSDRTNPHERITHIGGGHTALTSWRKTQQEAVREIEDRINQFHVGTGLLRVEIDIATGAYGNKYLKTNPDDTQQNNLLSLPECRG